MITISLQALVMTLLKNNQKFLMEISESFNEEQVLRFVLLSDESSLGFNTTLKEYTNCVDADKRKKSDYGKIVMYYDVNRQCVVHSCFKWYEILKNTIKLAKEKQLTKV